MSARTWAAAALGLLLWATGSSAQVSYPPYDSQVTWAGVAPTPFIASRDIRSGSGALLAQVWPPTGTPVRAMIYADTTAKPDEGAVGTAGTIANIGSQMTLGGDMTLGCGTFKVGTTITLGAEGIYLHGENPQCAVIQAANGLNADVLRIGYQGALRLSMRVSGITFNGNEGNNSSGNLVTFRDAGSSMFDHNRIISWEDNGLVVEATVAGVIGSDFAYNDFVGGKGPAIYQLNSGASPTDNRYSHNDIGGDPAQALFTACTSNVTPGECAVVRITSGFGLSFNNNHVWCGTSHTIPLALIGSAAIWDVDIDANTIENSWLDGIFISGVSTGSVTANKLYQIGKTADATYAGINLTSANAWVVTANQVRGGAQGAGRPLDLVSVTSGNNNLIYGNLGRDLGTTTPGPTPGYAARIISGGTNRVFGNRGFGGANTNAADELDGVASDNQGTIPTVLFANLGTPNNGRVYYCSDCTIANPCAGSGGGSLAKRLNGAWVCN